MLNDLRSFDRNGNSSGSARASADYADAGSFSPDGKRIALGLNVPPGTNNLSIWLHDFASNSSSRFSFDPSSNWSPVWSPNGDKILFTSNRTGPFNLYAKDSSGAGNEELVLKSDNWLLPDDWTASPETIVYSVIDPSSKFDLWVLPLTGDRKPFPFLKTPANESQAKVSNNGNWIAYCSDESGQPEVYVQPYLKKMGGRWQVSVNGGTTPKWRNDNKELFYLTRDGKVMSVQVKTGSTFEFAPPKVLFQTRLVSSVGASTLLREYEASPDGQKFLVRTPRADSEFRTISVILNWPVLLEKKN
jgi:Tol biopolymer transport system component